MLPNPSSNNRLAHRGMRLLYSTDTLARCQEESIGRQGLSRVDLLAILGCIVIAVALFLPQLVANRDRARMGTCAARQFRTALAIQAFDNEFLALPGYRVAQRTGETEAQEPISWAFPVLPFMVPMSSSILLSGPEGERSVEANEPFEQAANEKIVFRPNNYFELFTQYSAPGPERVIPNELIPELQCPAVWLEVRSDPSVPRNFLSWRVPSGLPDVSAFSPPDYPETAVWVDQLSPQQTPTSLEKIESWDGVSHTVLFSEVTRPVAWTSSEEPQVGLVAGWSTGSPDESSAQPVGYSERWVWAGVEQELGNRSGSRWDRAGGYHETGINVTFGDASTREISRDIDPRIWIELLLPHQAAARFPGTTELIEPKLP